MDYTDRLEAQMDEADRVEAANAAYLETLSPLELKKHELYRALAHWKQELAVHEYGLTSDYHKDYPNEIAHFERRRSEAEREIARIKLEIEKVQLRDEFETLHVTAKLHYDGLDLISRRQGEIEKQMTAIDEKLRKAVGQ